jgi:predicted dithiol-disulfide oxidoreductase (DUF899 family)
VFCEETAVHRPWKFSSSYNLQRASVLPSALKLQGSMKARQGPNLMKGEEHGLSVFFRLDEDVFHTYSVYVRGTESLKRDQSDCRDEA